MRERIAAYFRGRWLERVGQLVNLVGVVIALAWLLAILQVHIKVITQPGPQEYNEPAIWLTTWMFDHGRNPYTAAELPGAAYCFDPFYNFVVLALKPLLGIDYSAHRMINLVFLLLSLGYLVRLMVRGGAGLGVALLSVVFFHWLCLNNIMITARPDLLGWFLFLLSIFVPWERNYTRGSTILGLVCALVAFHCKSYFAVGGCATLLGYFMVRERKPACWMGVGFFALLGLTFAVWCHYFPYYYIESVIVQQGAAKLNSSDQISIMHTTMLGERAWPFLVVMLYGLGVALWRRQRARRQGQAATQPGDRKFHALGLVFLIYLVIIYFYMGRNAGAYFTYHLHLLFPLMFVLSAYAITGPWVRMAFTGLLLLMIYYFYHGGILPLIPGVPDSTAPYRRMEQLIYSARGDVLGIASTTDIFARSGRRVLHDGNTMFMGFAFADGGVDRDQKIHVLGDNYNAIIAEVEKKVKNREYALVLTEFDAPYFCSEELLKKNYDKEEQIDFFTYFGHSPVRVWRPKPKDPAEVKSP